jgi:transglutaminase-like putative cysteine protease
MKGHQQESKTRLAGRTVSALRGLVLASAAMVLCWPLTSTPGIISAALGSLVGALIADAVHKTRLRLAGGLGLAVLAFFLGLGLCRLLLRSETVATLLGPVIVLGLGEAVRWFALTMPLVFSLRLAAARRSLLAVLEVVMVALGLASGFAAHRDGMVHRPLVIGDWAWSRGIDPAFIFLAIGGLGTLLLAALLISEERRKRLPLHLSALFLVALVLFIFVRVDGLPKPQPAGDLGLTGEGETEASEEQGGQGQGQDQQPKDKSDELNDLEFKDEYSSQGSQAPVAVVVMHDDYSPPTGVYYFRQTVFSQFNGRRLVQSTHDDADPDVMRSFPYRPTELPEAPPVSEHRQPLRTSMGLLIDHVRPFALDSPAHIKPIPNPNPLRFQRAFEVLSHVQTLPYEEMLGRRAGRADWADDLWELYTEAPADPRYKELAEKTMDWLVPEFRQDALGQSLAIKNYLDKNGIYSRRSKHASEEDPAASFLFGDLTGYCVHFAHAATYLYRSRGIPARVAAGYAVGEASRGSGSAVVIRGADAHAWPEIYLEDVGWVVVDLTPEQTLDEPNGEADPDLQRLLGEMMRQQEWKPEDLQAREPFDPAILLRALALILALVLGMSYGIKLYRRWAPRFVASHHLYRVAYRTALDRLVDAGVRRRLGESRELFAQRASRLAPSFGELTTAHLGVAFGSRRVPLTARFLQLGEQLRDELSQQQPRWRRALGALNPLTWWLAR